VNSQHIDVLRRGPRRWNAWRAENPSIVPNLSGIALSAAERQMGPISGGPIDLSGAKLRHASLRFATLTGANLSDADLSDADLSDSRLNGADLRSANLSEALLERADFEGANLAGANLCGAILQEARNLTQSQIEAALGDVFSLLPPHLTRPHTWTGAISQVVRLPRPREETQPEAVPPSAPEPTSTVGSTVSWLVGGPRSTNIFRRNGVSPGKTDGA
jgi:hypothetical protein